MNSRVTGHLGVNSKLSQGSHHQSDFDDNLGLIHTGLIRTFDLARNISPGLARSTAGIRQRGDTNNDDD